MQLLCPTAKRRFQGLVVLGKVGHLVDDRAFDRSLPFVLNVALSIHGRLLIVL